MKKQSIRLTVLLCVLVAFACVAYWPIVEFFFKSDFQKSSQFGDTFGALNTLFTGLAFVVVLATLIQQSHQIKEAKQDIEDDRRSRLKLDLFDRRYRVYQATLDFIGNVLGNLHNECLEQRQMAPFDAALSEAFFLFAGEADLLNYLEELKQKSNDFANLRAQAKKMGLGSQEGVQRDAVKDWLLKELKDGAKEKFVPYLSIHSIPSSRIV